MITALILVLSATWCGYVAVSRRDRRSKGLLIVGLVLRLVGAVAYLGVIGAAYGGGDYDLYINRGSLMAERMAQGDWEIVSGYLWNDGLPRFGTQFVVNVTAFMIYLFGTSLLDLFLIFSLLGFAGCVLIARAIRSGYGTATSNRVLVGLMLFPSLWFWPSVLGKDAIVLLGLGIAVAAFASRRHRWGMLLVGLSLVFLIRPQVTAVVVFSMALARTLGAGGTWTLSRAIRTVGVFGLVGITLILASDLLGFSFINASEIGNYLSTRASQGAYGGSSIELRGPQWLLPVLGLGTVLFRPFLWEASGLVALAAAVEIFVFWMFALSRWPQVKTFLSQGKKPPIFWFALVFLLVYGTLLGLALGNLGTFVRQRVHLYPFLFLFMLAIPPARVIRSAAHRQARAGGRLNFGRGTSLPTPA